MDQNTVSASAQPIGTTTWNYAGFWIRLLAFIIDAIILGVVFSIISTLFGLKMNAGSAGLSNLLSLVIGVLYYVIYQHRMGQTLGKKVMKIKVVNAQGQTPEMTTFFLREIIGKFVSGLILGIGFLMIAWDSRKQGLHDKIASTYVIKV